MTNLRDLELRVQIANEQVRPIAESPVDIKDIDKLKKVKQIFQKVFDEAQVSLLVDEVISLYLKGSDKERDILRNWFQIYKQFAWASIGAIEIRIDDDFRRALLLFSVQDQGRDSRDAILELHALKDKARVANVTLSKFVAEVATISSSEDKYGMGSTRQLLLKYLR